MDSNLALGLAGLAFTAAAFVGSSFWFVFKMGGHAALMKSAADEVRGMKLLLERIPSLEQYNKFTDERLRRLESYHRELAGEVSVQRGRLESMHD